MTPILQPKAVTQLLPPYHRRVRSQGDVRASDLTPSYLIRAGASEAKNQDSYNQHFKLVDFIFSHPKPLPLKSKGKKKKKRNTTISGRVTLLLLFPRLHGNRPQPGHHRGHAEAGMSDLQVRQHILSAALQLKGRGGFLLLVHSRQNAAHGFLSLPHWPNFL